MGCELPMKFASVLVDTYNHERFIEEAIVSVLKQDFPASDFEILVVDDGSTDRTAEIVKKFAPRVRLLTKANGGQASAFNAGIPECKGEIVAFLDGDDWWAPGKLDTVVRTLQAKPEVGVVGHAIYETDEVGLIRATIQPDRCYYCSLRNIIEAREFLSLRAFLGTSRLTARRALLERALPLPEDLTIQADEYLFTVTAAISGALVLTEPLTFYRIHSGNLYQFAGTDTTRLRRKQKALACLAHELPVHLRAGGLSEEIVELLARAAWVDAERSRLVLNGGWSWQTFDVERLAYQLSYSKVSASYRVFQAVALAVSLLLPPRRFYELRNWYTRSGLARHRARLADSIPTDTLTRRRVLP
jgi:glycosyltransferase involved in cell wall biosynthesis